MKKIKCSANSFALVSDNDYEKVSGFKWYLHKTKNAVYARGRINERKLIYMHRFITEANKNEIIDHINGNGLDNRIDNLRICTKSQNNWNRKITGKNTSGYKGVSFSPNGRKKKWAAKISFNNKHKTVGYFNTKEEAAIAWNSAAKKYHGKFAYQNDIIN